MKNYRNLRPEYKVAIFSVAVATIISVASLIFVVLPTYDLVSSTDSDASAKLDNLSTLSGIFFGLTAVLAILAVVTGGLGVYKDVRKPKK